jgi:K+ transporter
MVSVVTRVFAFRTPAALAYAYAYDTAVTGTIAITHAALLRHRPSASG